MSPLRSLGTFRFAWRHPRLSVCRPHIGELTLRIYLRVLDDARAVLILRFRFGYFPCQRLSSSLYLFTCHFGSLRLTPPSFQRPPTLLCDPLSLQHVPPPSRPYSILFHPSRLVEPVTNFFPALRSRSTIPSQPLYDPFAASSLSRTPSTSSVRPQLFQRGVDTSCRR